MVLIINTHFIVEYHQYTELFTIMIITTGGAVTAKAISHSSLFKIAFHARRLPAMITRQGASSSDGVRRRDHSSASSSAAACSIGNMIRTPRVREQPGSGADQVTNGAAPSGGEFGAEPDEGHPGYRTVGKAPTDTGHAARHSTTGNRGQGTGLAGPVSSS